MMRLLVAVALVSVTLAVNATAPDDASASAPLALNGSGSAEESSDSGANEWVRVRTLVDGEPQARVVTPQEADALRAAFLARHSLADEPGAATAQDQQWPVYGLVHFHEKGWYQMGARCPRVEPEMDPAVQDAYDEAMPGEDDRLGNLTTYVSEFPVNQRGSLLLSALEYWELGSDYAGSPTSTLWYTNWTLTAGPRIDYYCREPTGTSGPVVHESIAEGRIQRID